MSRYVAVLLLSLIVSPLLGQSFVEYPIPTPNTGPEALTTGPDGNVWFVELRGNNIGRITPSGVITEFPIPTASPGAFGGIVTGPDGALWFTEQTSNKIGRIATSGSITEFTVPTASSLPTGIAAGPDGNLWFAEVGANKIGKLTTGGTFTEFPVPTSGGNPGGIVRGPDGNLWFTEFGAGKIGSITIGGSISEFSIPTAMSSPHQIAVGPDGNLWFAESAANKIGRITTSGVVTEFSAPVTNGLRGIAAGPDGNLYFTEPSAGRIGRITTAGVITELTPPTANSFPAFITLGPDGNMWFGEASSNQIGVLILQDRAIIAAVASAAGAGGSFFKTGVQLYNAGSSTSTGRIVFHKQGVSGSDSDPSLPYTLNAGETRNIPDLLPAMGQAGLGSADIVATSGSLPTVVARVFNDGGTAGTAGFTEEIVKTASALAAGDQFAILVPANLSAFRLNIGVRTLGSGAALTVTVRNSSGTVVNTLTKSYGATFFEQISASAFLGGFSLSGNESITVRVDSGNLIVYGATTDNRTQGPSIQLGRKLP